MLDDIHAIAADLERDIEIESLGFESRFLNFVRDYSANAELERAAVMANLKFRLRKGRPF